VRFAVAALCLTSAAEAQRSRVPADSVHISMVVEPSGRARSRMHVRLTAAVRTMDFTYLAHSCNSVTGIAFARAAVPLGLSIDSNPPWVTVHDTTELPDSASTTAYDGEWTTDLGDTESSVPVLVPWGALGGLSPGVRPKVVIEVRFPPSDPRARVISPRMTRSGSGWHATFNALPSSVRIRAEQGGRSDGCEGAGPRLIPGNSGRFPVIFASLIATMLLWVPLYFWWAHRQRSGE
jgi:hypothetical protein